jgi:multidrug efflux pump subunit AcrA (membrane-fusion protein)
MSTNWLIFCRARHLVASLLTAAALAVVPGCSQPATEGPEARPPEVIVAQPIVKEDVPALQFTGRTEAVNKVDVKARVSGYLEEVAFADGALVKTGDLLYQIDRRHYQATLAQANAAVAKGEAAVAKAKADLARAEPLVASGAVTAQVLAFVDNRIDPQSTPRGGSTTRVLTAVRTLHRRSFDLSASAMRRLDA